MGYIYAPSSFVQEGEPADLSEGNLWYSTTDKKLYVSDGTSYEEVSIETDLTQLEQQQLEQNLNILINSASASVLNDYDDMYLDIFSDSNGYDNTIDTASGTAIFDTDKYELPSFGDVFIVIEADDDTINWTSNSTKLYKLSTGKWVLYGTSGTDEVMRANIHKSLWYGTDGTNQLILDFANMTSLQTSDSRDVGKRGYYAKTGTASYGGGNFSYGFWTGTFSDTTNNTNCSSWGKIAAAGCGSHSSWEMPSGSDLIDASGTTIDELGLDKTADQKNNPATCQIEIAGYATGQGANGHAVVVAKGEMSWVATTQNGYSSSISNFNPTIIDFYTTHSIPEFTSLSSIGSQTYIAQTNVISIDANPVSHRVFCHNSVAVNGTVDYDISFDGGTTWISDQSFDEKNTSVHNGSSMKLRLNLNGEADVDTCEISDYAVMLYY